MDQQTKSSSLSPVVFDTDILIEYARGAERARHFLARFPIPLRLIPSVVVMELLQGCHSHPEATQWMIWIQNNFAEICHLDAPTSKRALFLIQTFAQSRGLRVVDALIAATSMEKGARLATGNLKHFKIEGLVLLSYRPI